MRSFIRPIACAMAMLSAIAVSTSASAQDASAVATALADLDFVNDRLRTDYAGFPDKTAEDAMRDYEAQLELARTRIGERPEARIHAIEALLGWFEDKHLYLSASVDLPQNPYPAEEVEPRPAARANLAPGFSFRRLSDQTVMLRVPNFNVANAERFHALLREHHETIISTPNLLIDMRFNSGGGDSVYEPLMAYLYTRPIYSILPELRVSAANLAALEGYLANEDIPKDTRDFIADLIKRAQAADNGWVSFDGRGFSIQTFPTIYEFPRRVGILAEGAGSAGDQFAIDARFSRKVTLLGGPTAGVIDYSNVNALSAPSGEFTLAYPMSRSQRLPDEPYDNIGIPADIPFGDEVEDHIEAARAWLEGQAQ